MNSLFVDGLPIDGEKNCLLEWFELVLPVKADSYESICGVSWKNGIVKNCERDFSESEELSPLIVLICVPRCSVEVLSENQCQ
jgi:hypothetical protein